MSTLSYGLNIPKRAQEHAKKPVPAKSKVFFNDESENEEEEENGPEAIESFTNSQKKEPSSHAVPVKDNSREKRSKPSLQYNDLSSNHTAAKHAASAQELDASIYDYDGVYDTIHTKPLKKKAVVGPRYMQNLLESAEVRKRDQLRAKEKMLAKEREAEGDEFADKERFVTAAYRAQQEELKRLEEQERKKEEEAAERRKREGGGMRGMYKDILAREDERREAIAQALENGAEVLDSPSTEVDEAKLAKEKGAVVNEEGQVVDKRELLKAGINLGAKPRSTNENIRSHDSIQKTNYRPFQGSAKAAMRERQSRLIEEQLEQSTKRAAEEDAAEQEAIQRAAKSQKTEGEISSARERYLQRKREAEAAKAASSQP